MFKNLKTSDRISLSFSMFTLAALFLFLVSINVVYFFIWYEDQKAESLRNMTVDYRQVWVTHDIASFKKHLLTKDTIIVPDDGEPLICSDGIAKKLHWDTHAIEKLNNSLFYKENGKVFFIFSEYYEWIWEVKILFDTTSYIKSQLIIIKVSVVLMLIFSGIIYFLWRLVARKSLSGLIRIAAQARENNLEDTRQKISVAGPNDDEIKILANTINNSFEKIHQWTQNLKQFITDVSHEFKTPLMWINSRIDLYNKKCEKWTCSTNEIQDLLVSIKSSTKRLNSLWETLFLFSRMQDGISEFNKTKVNISDYIKTHSQDILSIYSDKKIDFSYKIQPNISTYIDQVTFDMLLDNLLTNAIKFSKNNNISVEIWVNKKSFWVKDNWIGIWKKNLNKIWEKFYRDDTGKEWFGVWLFIVKRIVDLYEWNIQVKSRKWHGAKFEVFFK